MIIQNTSTTAQIAQPDRPVSSDGPRLVHVSNDGTGFVTDSSRTNVPQQLSSENLKSAVDSVNQVLRQSGQSLEISIDSATKRQIIRLMDTQTGELIRQIPSKEMLAIAQSIDQFLERGQLLSEKV